MKLTMSAIFTPLLLPNQNYVTYRWNYGNASTSDSAVSWSSINITFGRCKHANAYLHCTYSLVIGCQLKHDQTPSSFLSEGCGLCNCMSHLVVNMISYDACPKTYKMHMKHFLFKLQTPEIRVYFLNMYAQHARRVMCAVSYYFILPYITWLLMLSIPSDLPLH